MGRLQSTIRYALYIGGYGVMGALIGIYGSWIGALIGLIIGYTTQATLEAMIAYAAGGALLTITTCFIAASLTGMVVGISDWYTKRQIGES